MDELISLIGKEFASFELGEGVGWAQSKAMDMYADANDLAAARKNDRDRHWRDFISEEMDSMLGGAAFLDARGVAFYLPAFMIASLKFRQKRNADMPLNQEYGFLRCLAREDPRNPSRLLNTCQRDLVTRFLFWLGGQPFGDAAANLVNDWIGTCELLKAAESKE